MIALNETEEYAAEVPFTLPLTTDPLTGLTGHVFSLGEVKVRLPGSLVWVDVGVLKIIEKGYGRFCARLTSTQTNVAGTVSIRAEVAGAQPYFGTETISTLGGDISEGGEGYIPFFLPDEVDPVYGSPITTADFTAFGLVRICLPDDTYRDATVDELNSIVNLGYGGYALPLDATHTVKKGKVFIYVEYPGAQRFEGYSTILGAGVAEEVVVDPPTPIPVPVPVTTPQSTLMNLITHAVGRLCEYSKSGDFVADTYSEDGFDIPLDSGL